MPPEKALTRMGGEAEKTQAKTSSRKAKTTKAEQATPDAKAAAAVQDEATKQAPVTFERQCGSL